jgi:fatty-acyl-CoA synthase
MLPDPLARALAGGRAVGRILPTLEPRLHNPVQAVRALVEHGAGMRSVHRIRAAIHPDRPALFDDDLALTWRETNEAIDRLAWAIRDRAGSDARGVPVVLCMENSVAQVITWLAILRAGARVVHASFEATVEELTYIVRHAGAGWIVCTEAAREVASAVSRDLGLPAPWHWDGATTPHGVGAWSALALEGAVRAYPALSSRRAEAGNIVYTSGTTGKPKGALRDLAAVGVTELAGIIERLPIRDGERHWVAGRIYHSGAQAMVMLASALGGTIGIQRRFDAASFVRETHRHQIDSAFLVPTMIARVLEVPEAVWRMHPPTLRWLLSGAAPFTDALRRRAVARYGVHTIWDFYGATELGWVTMARGDEMLLRPGTVGRPVAGMHARVVDGEGRPLGPDTPGILQVRGPQLMQGYLRPGEGRVDAHRDPWMTVEDTARIDRDGYVYILGRARDMIISGGVNVYPAEVEEVISAHPGVHEAAVAGIPDDVWGERVEAWVVAPGVTTAELDAWVRARLSGARRPRAWHLVKALPRNPTGKVLKRELLASRA